MGLGKRGGMAMETQSRTSEFPWRAVPALLAGMLSVPRSQWRLVPGHHPICRLFSCRHRPWRRHRLAHGYRRHVLRGHWLTAGGRLGRP